MAEIKYKDVLADFITDIDNNPNLTDEEIFKAYPEFNNDKKLLDAAYQYRNTWKANDYDEPTLQSKFPEFFTPAQPVQQAGVSGGSLLDEQAELARQNAIQGATNDPNHPFVGQEPRVSIPRQANLVQEAVNKMATTPTPHMEVDENGLPQYTTTPLPIPTQASIDADRREQKSWFANFKEDIGRNWGTKEGLKQLARTIPSKFAASTVRFMNGLFAGAQQLSAGTMVGSQFGGVYQVPTLDEQYAAYRRVQNGSKDPKDIENSSAVRLIEQGKAIQERLSEKGNPIDLAEDEDFVSLARQGKISSFMRYGLGTAVESGMDNLMAFTPLGRVALASSIAGNRFHERSIENMDDVPLWARAVSAVGEGAIAQFVESRYNPFHVLDGLGKGGVKGVLHDIEEQAGKNMYKWIAKQLGKATFEEGEEELTENVLDDLMNNGLDLILNKMLDLDTGKNGLGWHAEYEKFRKQNKSMTDDEAMRAFAGEKAHQYLNDIIGGALGGLFMGGGRMAVGGRSIAQTAKDYSDLGTAMQDVADEMGVTIQDIAQVYDEQATMTPEQIEGRPDFRELNERLREAMIRRQQGIVNSPEEQQEAQQPQDRQTQLRQQAAQQAQQEVQGMAHQDGNVYYVGIKGKDDAEGYAVSGALGMVTDKDGMYSTSGRDLVTVKMNDGSVQQVPADELVVRDIPVSADELMQERTDHYFAQYANNDLFHVGDKVYLKQNGQQSAESSTIVDINDEGIEVEIIDPNGQPNTTVIPHEQAAEALAVAEGETEDNIVTYNVNGNELRLRDLGNGTYETLDAEEGAAPHRFTDADLAQLGAQRVEQPVSGQPPMQGAQPPLQQAPMQNPTPQAPMQPVATPQQPQFGSNAPGIDELSAEDFAAQTVEFMQSPKVAQGYLTAERAKVNAQLQQLEKEGVTEYNSAEEYRTKAQQLEQSKARLQAQIEKIDGAIAAINAQAEAAVARKNLNEAIRKRAAEFSKQLGANIVIFDSLEQIPESQAEARAMYQQAGDAVDGWYDPKTGDIYMNANAYDDIQRFEEKVFHEVVSHKGLDQLFGTTNYNALCDAVWNSMDAATRKKYMDYAKANNIAKNTKGYQRIAAKEYIAFLSESFAQLELNDQSAEANNIRSEWAKICDFLRELFKKIFGNVQITNEDLAQLIHASFVNMQRQAQGITAEEQAPTDNRETTETPAVEEQKSVDTYQSDNPSVSTETPIPIDAQTDTEGQQPAAEEQTAADFLNEALTETAKGNVPANVTIDETTIRDEEDSVEMDARLLIDGKPSNLSVTIFDQSLGSRGGYDPANLVKYYPFDNADNWSWEKADVLVNFFNKGEHSGKASVLDESDAVYFTSLQAAMEFAEFVNSDAANSPEVRLALAEAETDPNPTEAQKKAENYKQGHVTLWGLPITIENPKGSIRRGTDANGKQWEQEMHHTYGKIRRTEGVDGDHIDVFIGPNLTSDKVFVVDQRNVDTGEFDEHKCMLGFDSLEDAQNGYLSNYEEGWQGMGTVTEVTMDEFKKWIDSSHRKTKPFAEYKSVKTEGASSTAMEEQQAPTENRETTETQAEDLTPLEAAQKRKAAREAAKAAEQAAQTQGESEMLTRLRELQEGEDQQAPQDYLHSLTDEQLDVLYKEVNALWDETRKEHNLSNLNDQQLREQHPDDWKQLLMRNRVGSEHSRRFDMRMTEQSIAARVPAESEELKRFDELNDAVERSSASRDGNFSALNNALSEYLSSLSYEQLANIYNEAVRLRNGELNISYRLKNAYKERSANMDNAGVFDYAIKQQGEIPAGKVNKPKTNVKDWVADKNDQRAALQGIYHDPSGVGVATNAHIMLVSPALYDASQKGKTIKPDGTEAEGRFPNWAGVADGARRTDNREATVDWDAIRGFIAGVKEKMKADGNPYKKGTIANLAFRMPDGQVVIYRMGTFLPFAEAAAEAGANTLHYSPINGQTHVENNGTMALVMPVSPDTFKYDLDNERPTFYYDLSNGSTPSRGKTIDEYLQENGIDTSIPAMTEAQYLASVGLDFMGYSEPALHKGQPKTLRQRKKRTETYHDSMVDFDQRREDAKKEYQQKLAKGEIRIPTKIERLMETAKGHPDNQSVQSARRLLEKRGIDWESGTVNAETGSPMFSISDRKQAQFDLVQANNPMTDDVHTGIRSVEDIHTLEETLNDDKLLVTEPDWEEEDIRRAIEDNQVTIYSSKPIQDGTFVTPSRMVAEDYAGGEMVYEKTVSPDKVAWIASDEGQYADVDETEDGILFSYTPASDKTITPSVREEMESIKNEAVNNGTFMQAPNGKPTNLTERQWLQVRLRSFKRWFGDWENDPEDSSKVLDVNGEPMVAKHGTPFTFTTFDKSKQQQHDAGWLGRGFYFFTKNDDYAAGYAQGGRVLNTFLNIREPYFATNEDMERLSELEDREESARFTQQLIDDGYDGVYYDGDLNGEYVAFFPNQIKSATDNDGSFSEENDNILFSISNARNDIFYSNAERAVEGIKQEKATPEQWRAMIEKASGLKAGEDKWIGLSDWLAQQRPTIESHPDETPLQFAQRAQAERKKFTVSKQDILDYIRQNKIQIEEVEYGDTMEQDAFRTLAEEYREVWDELRRKGGLTPDELDAAAMEEMNDRHGGDDFSFAFNGYRGVLEVANDDAAAYYLEGMGGARPINDTRLRYTTYGLENKREIALTVPTIESWNESDEIHFGDAGEGRAIAWVRFGDATDEQGNKTLVIDEIQSKRHQEGREKGYKGDIEKERLELLKRVNAAQQRIDEIQSIPLDDRTDEQITERDRLHEQILQWKAEIEDLRVQYLQNAIPSAPFEKNWHELAMKRILRFAAENGYDKVAWTTGDQQARRYDLSKVIESIELEHVGNNGRKMFRLKGLDYKIITEPDGKIYAGQEEFIGKNLSDVVGKDVAKRMLEMNEGDIMEGDDLRIGGEGMRGFYDDILPRFMQKYGKKWGVQVGEVTMPQLEDGYQTMHAIDINDAMRESVLEGQPMFSITPKSERIEKLRNSEPIVVEYNGEYELNRKSAKDWAKKNIRGEYVNLDTQDKVAVSGVGIDEVLSHGEREEEHLKSIIAIPQMIKNSIFIEERGKEHENSRYERYKYYVCGLKIDGVDYTAKIVIGIKNGISYYDHQLTRIEKGRLIDSLNELSNPVANNQASKIDGKDKKLFSILQINPQENAENVQNASENADLGEETPKNTSLDQVLFSITVNHNSPYLLKKADGSFVDPETGERLGFDHRFMGRGEGGQAHGWGSYFSANDIRSYGEGYGFSLRDIKDIFNTSRWQSFGVGDAFDVAKNYLLEAHSEHARSLRKWLEDRLAQKQELLKSYEGKVANSAEEDLMVFRAEADVQYIPALLRDMVKDIDTRNRHHYDVEIPDDNGMNYFEEDQPLTQEQIDRLRKAAKETVIPKFLETISGFLRFAETNPEEYPFRKFYSDITDFQYGYPRETISNFLKDAGFVGIHYDGRRDGECYVIFDENDAKIVSHVMFSITVKDPLKRWEAENPKPKAKEGEPTIDYAKRLQQWNNERRKVKDAIKDAQPSYDHAEYDGVLFSTTPPFTGESIGDVAASARQRSDLNRKRRESAAITDMLIQLSKDNYWRMQEALHKINADIKSLRRAMRLQSNLDKKQVEELLHLYQSLIESTSEWAKPGDMPETTGMIFKNIVESIGKEDITEQINNIMVYLSAAQRTAARNQWYKLRTIELKKLNISGVVTQGKVAVQGQYAIQALNEALAKDSGLTLKDLVGNAETGDEGLIGRMMEEEDKATTESLKLEYKGKWIGYTLAAQHMERMEQLNSERKELLADLRAAENNEHLKPFVKAELIERLRQALVDNDIAKADAYMQSTTNLQDYVTMQTERAKNFLQHLEEWSRRIRNMATEDLSGVQADPLGKDRKKSKVLADIADWQFSTARDMQSLLRFLGRNTPDGKGALYNHFFYGYQRAADTEFKGIMEATDTMGKKVAEIFGKGYKTFEDVGKLCRQESKRLKLELKDVFDGVNNVDIPISVDNALYIYAVSKMDDGMDKLLAMNISREDVANLIKDIDPRLIELVDWVQNEFFVNLRNRYNPTHESLYGAPMDKIENYFPLRIARGSLQKNVDVAEDENDASRLLPGTSTGAIKRRTKNAKPLDILAAGFLTETVRHITQMEKWNAFAQWTRDTNILLSDIMFRERVKALNSYIYGENGDVYAALKKAMQMANGTYKSAKESGSTFTLNVAKGATSAKINFRVWTAMKQIASHPAVIPYLTNAAAWKEYGKIMANPYQALYGARDWALKTLPAFQKRISKRDMGDMRLMRRAGDWEWQRKILEASSKYGMACNMYVDTLTCAHIAKVAYESTKADLLSKGYTEEQATEKALLEAEIAFNTSQQSSESGYMAPVQSDRTWNTVVHTVFRVSPIQYTREWLYYGRNIGRKMKKGAKERMVDSRMRFYMLDGLSREQAQKAAESDYRKAWAKDVAGFVVYGWLMNAVWRLMAAVPYLLLGDDDDEKKKLIKRAMTWGFYASPITGLFWGGALESALDRGDVAELFDKEMPITSDIVKASRLIKGGKAAEVASASLNVLVQSTIGFDIAQFTENIADAVIAVKSDQDMSNFKKARLVAQSMISVPKSQWEQVLIDKAVEDAPKQSNGTWTKYEFQSVYDKYLENYIEYYSVHQAPLTFWARDEENEQKMRENAEKKYRKLLRERGIDKDVLPDTKASRDKKKRK